MISAITACPICGERLFEVNSVLRCTKNHCFDFAKEGYVNLFPPNQKHSDQPGDTKEMVLSRRCFLENKFYDIFAKQLATISKELLAKKSRCTVLDIGCGEGYYTNYVKNELTTNGKSVDVFAFDISKWAIKFAAKKHNHISFSVASAYHMPVKPNSVDLAINVFSPLVPTEICKCLKDDAFFVYAVPGERHLYGLKEILYDDPYENEKKDVVYNGLTCVSRIEIKENMVLTSPENIFNLFAMTPYYWKTPKEGVERLKQTQELTTEICFYFLVFKKDKKEMSN